MSDQTEQKDGPATDQQVPPKEAKAAPRPRSDRDALRDQLDKIDATLLPLLGTKDSVARMKSVVIAATVDMPDLLSCDRQSLMTAVIRAANQNLLPDGVQAVLLPKRVNVGTRDAPVWVKHVQYMPMVRGLLDILWSSGTFTYIDAAAIHEQDVFKYTRGLQVNIEHEPCIKANRGAVIGAYFVCFTKDSPNLPKVEVVGVEDLTRIKAQSKDPNGGWTKWPDQFAIKAVIKRACKQLPRIDRLERAIDDDNEALGFEFLPQQQQQAVQQVAAKHGTAGLRTALNIQPTDTTGAADGQP